MKNPERNAAIFYAEDGFEPESKGINGRRVAGSSFLNGFLSNADVDEFVSFTVTERDKNSFEKRVKESGRGIAHRNIYGRQPEKMSPVGTLYFPSPTIAEKCWQRQRYGAGAWSICGITHTTATKKIMSGLLDMRAAPQTEWDAIICTSKAVQAATSRNLDLVDLHLKMRFGYVPPRPQLPVIPLGIDCSAFEPDHKAGVGFREKIKCKENDVIVATLSRLIPSGKFDPGPLFLALQAAQEELGSEVQLHFVACGIYGDAHCKKVFNDCARAFMPDVPFIRTDGASKPARIATLSAADIFAFPIDNIQETFGLAPIEAMAAGLPVVTSDWDGMRDTVMPQVGIRVPTLSASREHTMREGWAYQNNLQNYIQYTSNVAATTSIDIPAMAKSFVDLARNPDLRRKMGAAGRRRAREEYDWSVVIPKMQDFWQELSEIRKAKSRNEKRMPMPHAPSPMWLFSSYPTRQLAPGEGRFFCTDVKHSVDDVFTARGYEELGNPFESRATLKKVFAELERSGKLGATASELSERTGLPRVVVERSCLFFTKFHLARFERG